MSSGTKSPVRGDTETTKSCASVRSKLHFSKILELTKPIYVASQIFKLRLITIASVTELVVLELALTPKELNTNVSRVRN